MDNTIPPFCPSPNLNRHMKFPSARRHRSVVIPIIICLRYPHFRLLALRSIEEGTVFYISRFHAYTFGCSMLHGISNYVPIISHRSWESTMTFSSTIRGRRDIQVSRQWWSINAHWPGRAITTLYFPSHQTSNLNLRRPISQPPCIMFCAGRSSAIIESIIPLQLLSRPTAYRRVSSGNQKFPLSRIFR